MTILARFRSIKRDYSRALEKIDELESKLSATKRQRDNCLQVLTEVGSRLDRWMIFGIDVGPKGKDADFRRLIEKTSNAIAACEKGGK